MIDIRIEDVKEAIQDMREEFDGAIGVLENRFDNVMYEIDGMHDRINELESDITSKEDQIEDLSRENDELASEIATLKETIDRLEDELNEEIMNRE